MPVKVFSGIAPPQALLDAIAASSLQPSPSKPTGQNFPTVTDSRPSIPPRPSGVPVSAEAGAAYDDAPPSYEDTMAENLSPVDGPRREYHPPDASTVESGTDAKSPVQTEKVREGGRAVEGSALPREDRRSSSESFDMLPTTPPESNSGSPPASPVRRSQSTMKAPRNPAEEESPPQYQQVADKQLQVSSVNRRPSNTNMRSMNLGVPNRKPVPRSADRRT